MDAMDERTQIYRGDMRPTEELFQIALEKDSDAEDDMEYWTPIKVLQHRLPTIFSQVKVWGASEDAKAREIAANVLGHSLVEDKAAVEEFVSYLLRMLEREASPRVIASICYALGHLHDSRSIGALRAFKDHPDSDVRHAVVFGLLGHEDARAIGALIQLSADTDSEVRNWATFGLGSQIDTNSLEVRDALAARLQEPDAEIRGEAIVGLARRGDLRTIEPLLRELGTESAQVLRDWVLVQDAAESVIEWAAKTRSQAWIPLLEKLKCLAIGDQQKLDEVIGACTLA